MSFSLLFGSLVLLLIALFFGIRSASKKHTARQAEQLRALLSGKKEIAAAANAFKLYVSKHEKSLDLLSSGDGTFGEKTYQYCLPWPVGYPNMSIVEGRHVVDTSTAEFDVVTQQLCLRMSEYASLFAEKFNVCIALNGPHLGVGGTLVLSVCIYGNKEVP